MVLDFLWYFRCIIPPGTPTVRRLSTIECFWASLSSQPFFVPTFLYSPVCLAQCFPPMIWVSFPAFHICYTTLIRFPNITSLSSQLTSLHPSIVYPLSYPYHSKTLLHFILPHIHSSSCTCTHQGSLLHHSNSRLLYWYLIPLSHPLSYVELK